MSNFYNILKDIEILARSTQEDYEAKNWTTYPDHVAEFNRLLVAAKRSGLNIDIHEIKPVPRNKLAHIWGVGAGVPAEQAKLREVNTKAERLLARVSFAVGSTSREETEGDALVLIKKVCTRFHSVAKQLRSRREGRPTLEVEDEYDVQDLYHALLCLFFVDIRPEEQTPSYAGGSARMDFLLKREQMVIETKKTRRGLSDKELGEQLILDIEKYAKHPDCKTLVCFVYDPEGRISNPRGVETDLISRSTKELKLVVYIRPTEI